MDIRKFIYEGQTISFEFDDGNKMINATQMIKPFGKRINNFLRLPSTQLYISILEKRYANTRNENHREILRIIQAGNAKLQGTRMDEKLALKFAAWLSPEFELRVYDRIYELFTIGKPRSNIVPGATMLQSLRMVVDQLEIHEQDIDVLKDSVQNLEAKIRSIDENYYSISGYCALQGKDCPLDKAQERGLQATVLSHNEGKSIGKAYDAKYGTINTYHKDILKELI